MAQLTLQPELDNVSLSSISCEYSWPQTRPFCSSVLANPGGPISFRGSPPTAASAEEEAELAVPDKSGKPMETNT